VNRHVARGLLEGVPPYRSQAACGRSMA
jgi:hypothetical protein